jgi:hypothetical protein
MSAAGSYARGGVLQLLLEELSRRAHALELFVPVESLRLLGEEVLQRRRGTTQSPREEGPAALTPALERELQGLHARRQAELLRGALELAFSTSLEGRWWTAPDLAPPSHASWLALAGAAVDDALADDADLDGELLACCLHGLAEWPSAKVLAAASAALDPGWRGRLALLRADLLEAPLAPRRFEELLSGDLPLGGRARVRHLAALSAERSGDLATALEHSLASISLSPEPRAALSAWALATELRAESAAEVAWRAMRSGESVSAGLQAYLWRELRARRRHCGRPLADELRHRCESLLLDVARDAGGVA